MRRSSVVAVAAIMAAVALTGLPAPAGSQSRNLPRAQQAATLLTVPIPANDPADAAAGPSDGGPVGEELGDTVLVEPGRTPKVPARRARVDQPESAASPAWKPPESTISGTATFYDHGTTAMRLPAGTVVRVCGPGGCIQRTVDDWGPQRPDRIIDLHRPDFFRICGCPSWSGTVEVTVAVY